MSSKAPYVGSISSMMPSSPKTSQQQSISSSSNNEPNGETSHVDPQGLSTIQIQANPFFHTNPLYYLDILNPMPSYTQIPIIPSPEGPIQNASPSCKNMNTFQESPMHIENIVPSLEVALCQEDNLKNEETTPIINQDQDTKTLQPHPMVEKDPTSIEYNDDPLVPFHFFQDDPLPCQEKSILLNPIPNPLPKQDQDASSTFLNGPIQNELSNTFPTLSNGPLPCQDQIISLFPCHNSPCFPQESTMPIKPSHDPIIPFKPPPPQNGLASSIKSKKKPFVKKIFQSMHYQRKGLDIHEHDILEPPDIKENLHYNGYIAHSQDVGIPHKSYISPVKSKYMPSPSPLPSILGPYIPPSLM